MKFKTLLASLMTFAGLQMATAQDFSDFAPIGTEWWYSGYRYLSEIDPPTVYVESSFVNLISAVDTVYAGKSCRKIDKFTYSKISNADTFRGGQGTPYYVYSEADTVFYYHTMLERFVPLYIFSAEPGDTLTYYMPPFDELSYPHISGDSFQVVVDSIIEVDVNGTMLETFALGPVGSSGASFSGNDQFAEIYSTAGSYTRRLGAPHCGFLPPTVPATLPSHSLPQLICYSDADVFYTRDGGPCSLPDMVTAISSLEKAGIGISVYPNPANRTLHIENSSNIKGAIKCTVTDITGRVMLDFELKKGNTSVDISSFPSVIYIARFTADGQSFHKKIVKK